MKEAYYQWILGWFKGRTLLDRLNYKIIGIAVVAPFLLLKFFVVPKIASGALATYAEGHGIELEVEDWSSDILNLSATAHEAKIFVSGPFAQKELLKAKAIEIDLSLWSGLFGGHWTREIRIREPKVYLERLLTGRWNWQGLADLRPALSPLAAEQTPGPGAGNGDGVQTASVGLAASAVLEALNKDFSVPKLEVEEMDLQWVENLPGNSGGGIIQEVKATLFIDDMAIQATDLRGIFDPRPQPSRLSLEARTGSGKVSLDGQANLFHWSSLQGEEAGSVQATNPAWTPTLNAKIYLENVGANAFARLTPDAALVPERGSLSGNIELRLAQQEIQCLATLQLQDVTFAVNRSSPLVGSRADQLESQLAGYRITGSRQFDCGGLLVSKDYRPFQAFLTNVTRKGVDQAPTTVRAVAAVEHSRYSEEPIDQDLQRDVDRLLRNIDPEVQKWLNVHQAVSSYGGRLPDRNQRNPLERAKKFLGFGR